MLSSSPAVPIHRFDFSGDKRRLSIHTAHGQTLTSNEGLPSPEHLTPITGNTPAMTPHGGSPDGSESGSADVSRRPSQVDFRAPRWEGQDGGELTKVNSRGGLWHEDGNLPPPAPRMMPRQISPGSTDRVSPPLHKSRPVPSGLAFTPAAQPSPAHTPTEERDRGRSQLGHDPHSDRSRRRPLPTLPGQVPVHPVSLPRITGGCTT